MRKCGRGGKRERGEWYVVFWSPMAPRGQVTKISDLYRAAEFRVEGKVCQPHSVIG